MRAANPISRLVRRACVLVAKVILWIIEGPDRPWWAWWIPIWLAVGMLVANARVTNAPDWLKALPVALLLVGAMWRLVRLAQIRAVVAVATDKSGACPFCGYRLDGVKEDICPECGRRPHADAAHLRATMGIDGQPPQS